MKEEDENKHLDNLRRKHMSKSVNPTPDDARDLVEAFEEENHAGYSREIWSQALLPVVRLAKALDLPDPKPMIGEFMKYPVGMTMMIKLTEKLDSIDKGGAPFARHLQMVQTESNEFLQLLSATTKYSEFPYQRLRYLLNRIDDFYVMYVDFGYDNFDCSGAIDQFMNQASVKLDELARQYAFPEEELDKLCHLDRDPHENRFDWNAYDVGRAQPTTDSSLDNSNLDISDEEK